MNFIRIGVASAALLALAGTVPLGASGQTPAPLTAPGMYQRHERHPEIRRAIRTLERAIDYMQHAAHDFGGHREAAVDASQRAVEQLKLALQYDRH